MSDMRRRGFITLLGGPQMGRSRHADEPNICKVRRLPMLKSVAIIILAIALGVAAWLLPMRGRQATAQPGTLHVLVVEFDIVPAEIDKFMTAMLVV